MRALITGLSVLVLVSCGVDGAPLKPSARAGVSIGSNGVSTNASIGASKGPVSIKVGL